MAQEIKYKADSATVVHRGNPMTDPVRDVYTGVRIEARIHDNGSLYIYEGNAVIAAYPEGKWNRVTPEVDAD